METLPLNEFQRRVTELIHTVQRTNERITVTEDDEPAVVIMSADDLDRLQETIAVLADRDLMNQLDAAHQEIARGEVLSDEEMNELTAFMEERKRRLADS